MKIYMVNEFALPSGDELRKVLEVYDLRTRTIKYHITLRLIVSFQREFLEKNISLILI